MYRYLLIAITTLCCFSSCESLFHKKPSVILDAEMSPNDLMSLYLLSRSPKAHLIGVTVSSTKKTPFNYSADHAASILMLAEQTTIPVGAFASEPLCPPIPLPAQDTIEQDSLESYHLPISPVPPVPMEGAECINKWISEAKDKVTLLCLGPLQNVANALIRYPHIKKKIEKIVILGGSIHTTQRTAVPPTARWKTAALYNLFSAPCSVRTVLASGVPIVLIPLDVVSAIPDSIDLLKRYQNIEPKNPGAKFVLDVITQQISTESMRGIGVFWDMIGVTSIIAPRMFTFDDIAVDIVADGPLTGHIIVSETGFPVSLCVHVDHQQFFDLFFSMVNE